METVEQVIIRDAEASDLKLIVNSWSHCSVDNALKANFSRRFPRERHEFLLSEANSITKLLQLPDYNVKVCCNAEDNDHIYGYIAYSERFAPEFSDQIAPIVDFCYVKLLFRRFGIGSLLASCVPRSDFVYVSNPSSGFSYLFPKASYISEAFYRGV
jgi:hypothetical protein